jgi:hypothetical protein
LDVIKNHKGDFIVDRYIIEWKKKITLKRYEEGVLHRVEGNIAIFFLKIMILSMKILLSAGKRKVIK